MQVLTWPTGITFSHINTDTVILKRGGGGLPWLPKNMLKTKADTWFGFAHPLTVLV